MKSTHSLAPLVLRLGLAYVFVTFGCEKIADWRDWAPMVSGGATDWVAVHTGIALATLLRLLGYGEIVIAVHLAFGFCTRAAAALAVVLLGAVVATMGRTGIGVRDVGLLAAAAALVSLGGGALAVDAYTTEPTS